MARETEEEEKGDTGDRGGYERGGLRKRRVTKEEGAVGSGNTGRNLWKLVETGGSRYALVKSGGK